MKTGFQERDTFPSTYKKDYVWHERKAENKVFSPSDAYALSGEERRAFLDPNAIKEIPWDAQLEIINDLYSRRMRTTYYKSYCERPQEMRADEGEEGLSGDPLVDSAERLYAARTRKVLQPVATARRVMGYCRPARYHAGLSEYQDGVGRLGLDRLADRSTPRPEFCDRLDPGGRQT